MMLPTLLPTGSSIGWCKDSLQADATYKDLSNDNSNGLKAFQLIILAKCLLGVPKP